MKHEIVGVDNLADSMKRLAYAIERLTRVLEPKQNMMTSSFDPEWRMRPTLFDLIEKAVDHYTEKL